MNLLVTLDLFFKQNGPKILKYVIFNLTVKSMHYLYVLLYYVLSLICNFWYRYVLCHCHWIHCWIIQIKMLKNQILRYAHMFFYLLSIVTVLSVTKLCSYGLFLIPSLCCMFLDYWFCSFHCLPNHFMKCFSFKWVLEF